jgi:hypothetical protein
MADNKMINGKIYKIVSSQTEKVYVGSTTQTLEQRLSGHRRNYKKYLNGKYSFVTSFDIIKFDDNMIVLIENVVCNSIDNLREREKYYIKSNDTVNKNIPSRSRKEYRNDKKDKIKEYQKHYCYNNKEKLNKNAKEYHDIHKVKINEYQKDYRDNNKDKLNKNAKQKYTCECGGNYTHANKSQHNKTTKHIKYINKQQ